MSAQNCVTLSATIRELSYRVNKETNLATMLKQYFRRYNRQ